MEVPVKMERGQLRQLGQFAIASMAVALGAFGSIDAAISPMGGEYAVLGHQAGDQFLPKVSVGNQGGYLVWHDNNTDEDGLGIRAVRLDPNLNASFGEFRVNENGNGDQQRPIVVGLRGGGAAFAWEDSGDIMIRFVNAEGVFSGSEQKANSHLKGIQRDPVMATLSSGNVIIAWSSLGQKGTMHGIYAQRFDPDGNKLGSEFFVNQSAIYNQRTPAVAALEGGFVIAWISERRVGIAHRTGEGRDISFDASVGGDRYQVQMMGRLFDEKGIAISDEMPLGDASYVNANPALVATKKGFMAFYSGKENVVKASDLSHLENGWDIFGQHFSKKGVAIGEAFPINQTRYGDQLVPSVSRVGDDVIVAWTSLGQDGDREGIFGRLIEMKNMTNVQNHNLQNHNVQNHNLEDHNVENQNFQNQNVGNDDVGNHNLGNDDLGNQNFQNQNFEDQNLGNHVLSSEFQINSITANRQLLPAVGGNSNGKAIVVWGSFRGGRDSFDLQAQKFSQGNPLPKPEAPFVFSSGYGSIGVSWAGLDDIEDETYELYLDGSEIPIQLTENMHTFSNLPSGSEHSIELAYVFSDGRRSSKSEASVTSTWGQDRNFDGLPDDWQEMFFGKGNVDYAKARDDFDDDGAMNFEELLAGTDPTDAESILQTEVISTEVGLKLRWNTERGGVYRVQISTDVSSWEDVGVPRLAMEEWDSVSIDGDHTIAVYRVLRIQ